MGGGARLRARLLATMRYVILPQAVRAMIPPTVSLAVGQLQVSSLISIIGVVDLTKVGTNLNLRTLAPFTSGRSSRIGYFLVSKPLSMLADWTEKRLGAPAARRSTSAWRRSMIEVEHIDKSFGAVEVLKDISATFADGEVVAIIGPSGGGKSTLIRCINGLERLDARRHPGRRQVGPRPRGAEAIRTLVRDGVPAVQPLSAHDGARQHHAGADRSC